MFAQLSDLDLCRKWRQEETNVKKRSKDEEKTWQQHAPRTEKKSLKNLGTVMQARLKQVSRLGCNRISKIKVI